MSDAAQVLKKLQYKDHGQPVLIINAPRAYDEVISFFQGEAHQEPKLEKYDFVQVFGTTNEELASLSRQAAQAVEEDGLLWLCYPKKSSKVYKGSDCSRESVAALLADEGYEPVRQVAIDDDWSALRYRKVENIKSMVRKFSYTEKGKERTETAES
jgi:hypothetical protein